MKKLWMKKEWKKNEIKSKSNLGNENLAACLPSPVIKSCDNFIPAVYGLWQWLLLVSGVASNRAAYPSPSAVRKKRELTLNPIPLE